jgi:hypothetical protein
MELIVGTDILARGTFVQGVPPQHLAIFTYLSHATRIHQYRLTISRGHP